MLRAGVLVAFLVASAGYGLPVRVVDGGCDLRAAASDGAFVVSHVPGGETLQADDAASGDWISVRPPDRVSLWIYGDLVRDGSVIAPKVQIRAGPGINYEVVGTVGRGEPLNVRNSQGVWLEIAPNPGCRVWVKRSHVRTGPAEGQPVARPAPLPVVIPPDRVTAVPAGGRIDATTNAVTRPALPVVPSMRPSTPAPVTALNPPAPVTPTIAPVRAPVPAPVVRPSAVNPSLTVPRRTPPVPTDAVQPERQTVRRVKSGQVNLPADAEAVGIVSVDGVIRPMGLFSGYRSRPYRLVRRDQYNRAVTVCVLTGGGDALTAAVGLPVRIRGEQYLSDSSRYPIVAVSGLERLPTEPPPVSTPFLR